MAASRHTIRGDRSRYKIRTRATPRTSPSLSGAPSSSVPALAAFPEPGDGASSGGEGEAGRQAERGDGGQEVAVAEARGHRGDDEQGDADRPGEQGQAAPAGAGDSGLAAD